MFSLSFCSYSLGGEIILALDYSHGGCHQLDPLNSWGVLFAMAVICRPHGSTTMKCALSPVVGLYGFARPQILL